MTPDEIRGAYWRGQALRDEQAPAALSSASATEAALRAAVERLREVAALRGGEWQDGINHAADCVQQVLDLAAARAVLARIRKETPDHE